MPGWNLNAEKFNVVLLICGSPTVCRMGAHFAIVERCGAAGGGGGCA